MQVAAPVHMIIKDSMRTIRLRTSHQSGFTAIVIATLFVAIAVIMAIVVERNTVTQQITKRDATSEQLSRLSNAIIEYGVANSSGTTNFYPCPARLDLAPTNSGFGTSVPNCYNTTPPLASSIDQLTGPSSSVIRGMVPVQTLAPYGVNINDAFDTQGNRIMYVVNRRITLGSTTASGATADNPAITDVRTGQTLLPPDFIVMSYGRDGKGGWNKTATSVGIPCPAASTRLREENCDNDTAFVQSPTNTVAATAPADYFDDVLSFYSSGITAP
jgi:hypothetical protein